MVYISSDGQVSENRRWGIASISDLFWGLINFIVLFFQTLFNPNLTKRGDGYSSTYGSPRGQGPPGPPPRRMGGMFRHGGAGPPPMMGGG